MADTDMDTSKSTEPHEVALAREEVNMLLAEQRKTVALKVGRATGMSLSHTGDDCHWRLPITAGALGHLTTAHATGPITLP